MDRHKEYLEHNDLNGATHLEVSVYYTKGGRSFASGGTIPRGYYLSVKPVTVDTNSVSYAMYSGCRHLLLETKRFSAKQFAQAIEMAKTCEKELIERVVAENKKVA